MSQICCSFLLCDHLDSNLFSSSYFIFQLFSENFDLYIDLQILEKREGGGLDYMPVHLNTLDDEVERFLPKARVY